MKATEAHQRGYGVGNTPTRVILRSSKSALATYTQTVAGVPMKVFKTSTIFEKQWLTARVDAVAACPVLDGHSVSFTPTMITWRLPQRIDPLMSSGRVQLLEVYLGINGQTLDPTRMPAKLSTDDSYIIVQLPVGADGGYFKSHIQGNRYLLSYTIEPMLELLWTEDGEDTRYKVLFPITTPLLSLNLQVFDETVPKQQVFKLVLGHFAPDVVLMNITFPSEVLTIAQCHARGFNIREHVSPNSSLKVFTLEVPFTDPAVLQSRGMGFIVYSLHLTFGLLVLNEFAPFSHTVYLEATLEEKGLLKVSCYYDLNTTHAVSFHTRPRRSEPYAENAKGQLQVAMRLSLDDSFREFYRLEDSPIMKHLQQPLYFEVELMSAINPQVSLELENCWVTLDEDKMSQPRWDLIING
ncbi:uncharacterized protein LOC102206752 [Pundamilia nyererei]|uniref:Uncharacterized protein LOC102206752 n=1 Tax=Pundamilia nyererei TaxID=303518 RepID=A0A9Y3R1C0_9CICH|nr:PREDICTED: uncharacterized protein LOC102206752 [Pundamilia nyererei]